MASFGRSRTVEEAEECAGWLNGTRDVFRFFNREALVYANDFASWEALAAHLRDMPDAEWRRMRDAPPYAHAFPVIRNTTYYAEAAKHLISMAVLG